MPKSIPKREYVWLNILDGAGGHFVVTTKDNDRETYFLYSEKSGEYIKIGQSKNPRILEEKYIKYTGWNGDE